MEKSIEIKTIYHLEKKGDIHYYPIVDGKKYNHAGETEEIAYLIGLGIKYDGLNSQFVKMACRMLGIKSVWAE